MNKNYKLKPYTVWRKAKSANSPDGWVRVGNQQKTLEKAEQVASVEAKLSKKPVRIKHQDEFILEFGPGFAIYPGTGAYRPLERRTIGGQNGLR